MKLLLLPFFFLIFFLFVRCQNKNKHNINIILYIHFYKIWMNLIEEAAWLWDWLDTKMRIHTGTSAFPPAYLSACLSACLPLQHGQSLDRPGFCLLLVLFRRLVLQRHQPGTPCLSQPPLLHQGRTSLPSLSFLPPPSLPVRFLPPLSSPRLVIPYFTTRKKKRGISFIVLSLPSRPSLCRS